ncbi:MAG: DUF2470 domain-containing protein [Actinomycetota bacterium]
MPTFSDDVVTAVLAHMNSDHGPDSLTIVRAFADPFATTARMSGLDGEAGYWEYDGGAQLRIPWSAPISERPEIRREVVTIYDEARRRLSNEAEG